jgi:hypothetical protein
VGWLWAIFVVCETEGRPRHQFAAELSLVMVFATSVNHDCPLKGEAGVAESVSVDVARVSVRLP